MNEYAIGDIQGCYQALLRLLDHVQFNDKTDRLWFVGDLVNRGPESLAVLRFVKDLPITPRITLGNHDLHLLSLLFGQHPRYNRDDTVQDILTAPDAEELGHWLRQQSIVYHDDALNLVMCHAGINPAWNLNQAKACARELEIALQDDCFREFINHMYGNQPDHWSDELTGMDRLRVICNYFTRMRFCNEQGHLSLGYKGTIQHAPAGLYPWYEVPNRQDIPADIIFGHWAALKGQCPHPRIYALDTGCLWGGKLTALRLGDRQLFSVPE